MADDEVLARGRLRLLDVLLEEEFAAAPARPAMAAGPGRPRAQPWRVAALLLLGLAVVVAVALLGREPERAPVQDPPATVPFDAAKLGEVCRLVVALPRRCLVPGGDGQEPDPQASATIAAAVDVQAWLDALRQSLTVSRPWPDRVTAYFDLVLRDGRSMRGWVGADELLFGKTVCGIGEQLRPLLDAALQAARSGRDGVATLAELRALPPIATRIRTAWMAPADLQGELPRFAALEVLELGPPPAGASTAGIERALAAAPRLRRLRLPAAVLDREVAAALAALPQLRSLTLTGGLAAVPADAFAALVRLERLCLPDAAASAEQLRAIARLQRLQELRLFLGSADAGPCIRSLSALRRLALRGNGGSGATCWDSIAASRIEQLAVRGMVLDEATLRRLASLPSLRELDLRGVDLDHVRVESVLELQRLQRVYLGPDGPWGGRSGIVVQLTLGGCTCIRDPVSVDDPRLPWPLWDGGD